MNAHWVRWPLGTKILVGLLLNLVVVGGVFAVAVLLQLRFNPGWLLAGRAGERLQAVAEMLGADLALAAPGQESAVIERYREAYQLDFRLFDAGGLGVGTDAAMLPREVRREIARPRTSGPPNFARPNLPDSGAEPRSPDGPGPGSRRFGNPNRPGRGAEPTLPPLPAGVETARRAMPRIVLRAGVPAAYWIVIHLPPRSRGPGQTVVIRAPSLWAGGLLLDARPWLLAGLAAMALSIVFWLPFVRSLTRDIGRLTRQTAEIAAGRFDARLGLPRGDELGRLAASIDQMAERLAGHVAGQKRFLGDAAHELCAPIARLQTAVAILESRAPADDLPRLRDVREDLDEMAALVGELLAFSRATHGRPVRLEPVDLRPVVERAWAREGIESLEFKLEVPADSRVVGDALLLQRALANLFRNAVRYAGNAGPVTVRASREGDTWNLAVADSGPGVPADTLPRLFEPFYRPEPSRTRDLGGAGLGLAIVKTCVDACGGTATARNLEPRGFEVRLRLPAATGG
jgi:two-component system sensor histidine kinase CpxA